MLLAEAREKAAALYNQVKAGLDSLAERDAADAAKQVKAAEFARLAITFKQVAEEHLAANGDDWRNAKHRAQWAAP